MPTLRAFARPALATLCLALLGAPLARAGQLDAVPPQVVRLDDSLSDGTLWTLTKARATVPPSKEAAAKGAKATASKGPAGSLSIVPDSPAPGEFSQKLAMDFTDGGVYVGMVRDLTALDVQDITAFRMSVKTARACDLTVRVIDSTGQIHSRQDGFKLIGDGQWHDYTFTLADILAKQVFWGGANDGRWHGPGEKLILYVTKRSAPADGQCELLFHDIGAEVVTGRAAASAVNYREGFDASPKLPAGWEVQGDAQVVGDQSFDGGRSLRLARAKEHFDVVTEARGPAIAVSPGAYDVAGSFKSDLYSPDESFNASVSLLCLDGSGKLRDQIRVGQFSNTSNWTPLRKQVVLPPGTTAVRLDLVLNKTHGQFWADQLTLAPVAAPDLAAKSPVRRLILKTAVIGNLFLPGAKPVFDVTVETTAPLAGDRRSLGYTVRDYWGAEQAEPATIALKSHGTADGAYIYDGVIDLSSASFEVGKYYEVRATVDAGVGAPVGEQSSFAILPEAQTKKYPWRDIPFSSRDWDNRIPAYFTLTDRLGIRVAGIWGSWSAKPPYKATAPGIALCRQYDFGILSRTPIIAIEHHQRGYEDYTAQSLSEGVRGFIDRYGKDDRLLFVLGNEPEPTGPGVARNVALYKAMYADIKKASPSAFVIASSVGPAEEYFKLGFQNYCDAVDFHTYEDVGSMEATFKKYDELFAKYGGRKPIWCTECGLNSQGLPRRVIAGQLIRKFATFFSLGGQNISWFDICYPDRSGALRGGSDDSMNVFDGLYGNYSPRLDAIAYYNMVNGVCVKKFLARKTYAGGVKAFLFRDQDGHILQILFDDEGARDVFVPLPGAVAVRMIRIDGTSATLDAARRGLTLRVGDDPILLLYDSPQTTLPGTLDAPCATLASVPADIIRGETVHLSLALNGVPASALRVEVPPFWKQTVRPVPGDASRVDIALESPAATQARYLPLTLSLANPGAGDGDLTLYLPVRAQISASLLPDPATGDTPPGVELDVKNNSAAPGAATWKVSLLREVPVRNGRYSLEVSQAPGAYFTVPTQGRVSLPGGGTARIRLPLAAVDPVSAYKVDAVVTDSLGRGTGIERFVGGFVRVPRAPASFKLDASLTGAAWAACPPIRIDQARQFDCLSPKHPVQWGGPADISGEVRFLWDERNLYIGVKTTDNIFHNTQTGAALWAGDGIQILVDPTRQSSEKGGKYDYGFALTPNGPQAWCFLSGDGRVPSGPAADIQVSAQKAAAGGGVTYEIAIPWSRLLPFAPAAGADLGLALALNDDDGNGRNALMAWFGDTQTKEVAPVADLILSK